MIKNILLGITTGVAVIATGLLVKERRLNESLQKDMKTTDDLIKDLKDKINKESEELGKEKERANKISEEIEALKKEIMGDAEESPKQQ